MKELIMEFLNLRPSVIGAFGYGSGVFKQLGYDENDTVQIDLILIVSDIQKWHKENIKNNPKDYSFVGKTFLTNSNIQEIKGLTGITYQSNIKYKEQLFKYGVIEYEDFKKHMNTWDSFYVPGRFQKPILTIKSNEMLDNLIYDNRKNACKVGLLCMEEKTIDDLFMTICSLSYNGDTRMKVAENPNKVSNIVGANKEKFIEMYNFKELYTLENDTIVFTPNLNDLPISLEKYIGSKEDLEEVKRKILRYLSLLNEKESKNQTIKGIKTNGIVRSVKYGFAKILKKFRWYNEGIMYW